MFEPGKHMLIVNVISESGGHVGAELREFDVPARIGETIGRSWNGTQ